MLELQSKSFIKAFELIQDDLVELFDYIEPTDSNRNAYSRRIQRLFLRVCIEIEANLNAMLSASLYSDRGRNWECRDFQIVDQAHALSAHEVKLAFWRGLENHVKPFAGWEFGRAAHWYRDYQSIGQDKAQHLPKATLRNLVAASGALAIILNVRFSFDLFSHSREGSSADGFKQAFGDLFSVRHHHGAQAWEVRRSPVRAGSPS